jgi:microsomal epoxide hydrolase
LVRDFHSLQTKLTTCRRAVEAEINSFPNYHLPITHDGSSFDIHFVALFSERKDAVPILMLHGWPGSFLEFLPILRLLTNKYTPSSLPYHIVVPSLPGYAYSSPPPLDADFRLEDVSQILDELMVQLGFSSGFAVQGGDIGSKLARVMGGVHPHAKAIHLNFGIMPDPGNIPDSSYNALEIEGIVRAQNFKRMGSAYAVEHATRPSTIGLALSTNPLALLAWIGEKFLEWTDDDLPLETVFADVTLYWLTDCFATTLYPYRQLFTPGVIGAHENPAWHIDKPMGFSWFPKEIAPVPRAWIAVTGNLVFFRQHQKGGHFAALENPDVLLKDLEDFIGQVWPAVA